MVGAGASSVGIRLMNDRPGKISSEGAVELFSNLSNPIRLDAFRLLVRYLPYGLPAGEVARLLAVPHNTMSSHLVQLERAGLLTSRRDGRLIIYAAQVARLRALFGSMLSEIGGSEGAYGAEPAFAERRQVEASAPRYNVLVLCSGNSARSLMAEAILNREGHGRFHAFSAGSHPQDGPHPAAVSLLSSLGYETEGLRSKSWDEFAGANATPMDFIITVCDSAAGEACPFWPGHPLQAHWGIPDPVGASGAEWERRAAFVEAYRLLAARLTAFINLPFEKLDLAGLKKSLLEVGRMEGATAMALAA